MTPRDLKDEWDNLSFPMKLTVTIWAIIAIWGGITSRFGV